MLSSLAGWETLGGWLGLEGGRTAPGTPWRGSSYQNTESRSAKRVCTHTDFLNLRLAKQYGEHPSQLWETLRWGVENSGLLHVWGGWEATHTQPRWDRSPGTNQSCRGAPWHRSRMEICGVKGFRPGWTYSRRELDKKEEEWERREGRNDSVGKTLQIMRFPFLLEIREGVRQQCLLRRGTTLPALFVISHTPTGLGSSTALSPACWQIRLCGSFLIHQGWALCSLHFPCPHSNGQINFLVSLDTIFALGRKFSCIAKPLAA